MNKIQNHMFQTPIFVTQNNVFKIKVPENRLIWMISHHDSAWPDLIWDLSQFNVKLKMESQYLKWCHKPQKYHIRPAFVFQLGRSMWPTEPLYTTVGWIHDTYLSELGLSLCALWRIIGVNFFICFCCIKMCQVSSFRTAI